MSAPFSPVTCRDKKRYDSYSECDQDVSTEYISDYFLVNPQPPGLINEPNRKLHVIEYSEIIGASSPKVKAYMLIESIYRNAYMQQLSANLCLCHKASNFDIAPKIIDHYYCTGYTYNSAVITYEYFEYIGLQEYIKNYVTYFEKRNGESLSSILDKEDQKKSLEIFFVFLRLYKTLLIFTMILKYEFVLSPSFYQIVKNKDGNFEKIFLDIIYETTLPSKKESLFDINREFEKLKTFMDSILDPLRYSSSFLRNVLNHIEKCMEDETERLANANLNLEFFDMFNQPVNSQISRFIDAQIKIVGINLVNLLIDKEKINLTPALISRYLAKFGIQSGDLHTIELKEETIIDATLSKYETYNFPNCGYTYTKSSIYASGLHKKDIEKWKENKLFYVLDENVYKNDLPNPKNSDDIFAIYIERKIIDVSKRKKYIVFTYLPSSKDQKKEKKYFLLDEVNYEKSTKEKVNEYLEMLVLLGYYKICPEVYNNYLCGQLISSTISRTVLSAYHQNTLPLDYFLISLFQKSEHILSKFATIVSLFHCFMMQYLFLFSVLGFDYDHKDKWIKKIQINSLAQNEKTYFHFEEVESSVLKPHSIEYPTIGISRLRNDKAAYEATPISINARVTRCIKYFMGMIDRIFTLEKLTIDDIRKNVYLFQITKKYINDYRWQCEYEDLGSVGVVTNIKTYLSWLGNMWKFNTGTIITTLQPTNSLIIPGSVAPPVNPLISTFANNTFNPLIGKVNKDFTDKILNQYDESVKLNVP